MFTNKFTRNPFLLSTLLLMTVVILAGLAYFLIKPNPLLIYASAAAGLVWGAYNVTLKIKSRNKNNQSTLATESDTLADILRPLLTASNKKPIYLLMGNKEAGKSLFIHKSNSIKPIDKPKTRSNEYFQWFESDAAVYIEPNDRLVFQQVSNFDSELWKTFIREIISYNPRKPFAGCLTFVDFEYFLLNESEAIDHTLGAVRDRLASIGQLTLSTLPVYLVFTKIDKLDGFKEYIQFSPLKSYAEYLSIPMKEAKGAHIDYFADSFKNLVTVLESQALDSSVNSSSTDEKKATLGFPKQFELCEKELANIIDILNRTVDGTHHIDLRDIFFTSSLQGGRKYNLLAKSCSNYFNLPIIASEHSHLSEVPYFTRFLVESQILPEIDFAQENKAHLERMQRRSYAALLCSTALILGSGYALSSSLNNNLSVIDRLLDVNKVSHHLYSNDFHRSIANASESVAPTYQAWLMGNKALDHEHFSMHVSRLKQSTHIAYKALIDTVGNQLMPTIEQGYRIALAQNQDNAKQALPLLKGYLMLKYADKRDIPFLKSETRATLQSLNVTPQVVADVSKYLDAYFKTDFEPVAINMDLVRSVRRTLLAKSNVDLVYAKLVNQAKLSDLGSLNIERAIGFNFNDVFSNKADVRSLEINKLFTSTGFSTFYRPRVALMTKNVISDDWVLGLSNQVTPTQEEQQAFKEKVRQEYTDDYINDWRNALSELKVKKYHNIGELTNAIDLVSGPSSPLTTVLKQVYSNTHFSPDLNKNLHLNKGNAALNSAVNAVSKQAEKMITPDYVLMSRVEQTFYPLNQLQIRETANTPTPWEETITALSRLRTYLKGISDAPDPQMAALAAARSRMSSSDADPIIQLKEIAQKSPEPVRSWLMDIVRQSWAVMIHEASKGIQEQWNSEVYSKFRQVGLHKYPFDIHASEEISLADFEQLFSSGGILDNFIKENLAPFYDTNLWSPKKVEGEEMPLSSSLLVQLKNYNVIKNTLMSKSTNRFFIPFSATVMDLDSSAIRANIKLSDSTIHYYQGPSKISELQWPPKNGDYDVSITIQDITDEGKQHVLNESGQWAIYRLFDASNITSLKDGGFISNIKVSGRYLSLKIHPLTARNPFTLPELYNFTLPKKITI